MKTRRRTCGHGWRLVLGIGWHDARMGPHPETRGSTFAAARNILGWVAAVAALCGLAAIGLAGCIGIIEGCTYPYEIGAMAVVPVELDAAHPAATTAIAVDLSADALPGDVEDRGARLQLTLDNVSDVTLTMLPDGAGEPRPLVTAQGHVSIPLDRCEADEPCTARALVLLEWTHPQPGAGLEGTLKVEGLVRVPHTEKRCGMRSDAVAVTAGDPEPRPAPAAAAVGQDRHDASELVQHVTVRLGADRESDGPIPSDAPDGPTVARGHLRVVPDPDPPVAGQFPSGVPGIWLRVTPDDGGPPVLDGPMPTVWPILPADATFPIHASCVRPCERGYWIQAAVYDPAGHSGLDPSHSVYGWSFDASVSSPGAPAPGEAGVAVTLDPRDDLTPPASLVLRGDGAPFRVDARHPATTLAIDASLPDRTAPPYGDVLAQVPVEFSLTTGAAEPGAGTPLWLSNGHYLGDGSTGDDAADTGAWGGPGTVPGPAGRPFAACNGTTDPCAARTGLVLRRYLSVFDNGATTPPYDVHWAWSVVGAPPGATVTVQPLEGETLGGGIPGIGSERPLDPIAAGVVIDGTIVAVLVVLWVARRRRRRRAAAS